MLTLTLQILILCMLLYTAKMQIDIRRNMQKRLGDMQRKVDRLQTSRDISDSRITLVTKEQATLWGAIAEARRREMQRDMQSERAA